MRQNVLKRIGGSTWGAETNILRTTHKALIESIACYGLTAVGAGAYEADMRRVDTCALNPAVRSITGASFPARLIVLHSVAGAASIHNLYIQTCARTLDRGMRATNSSLAHRLSVWSAGVYRIKDWIPKMTEHRPLVSLPERKMSNWPT